ncbi:MAG: signal peptidase I [Proteobacteria bacterium]|nr:signal peptidase I [Pseudomonadota bacterium]
MDFALFMIIALIVTGLVWLYDAKVGKHKRTSSQREPVLVEYSRSFFPVILVVFLIRSFLVEPFKIPSGSMMPTLIPGDFILVNKFDYGIRVPVLNWKIFNVEKPQRGDVVVFRYPDNTSIDYIKRLIGLPGDIVSYHNKKLSINGVPVPLEKVGGYSYSTPGYNYVTTVRYHEKLGNVVHDIILDPTEPTVRPGDVVDFPDKNHCTYSDGGFTCKVPQHEYFMLGDNRDDSRDSRYWGFVPDSDLVGKAFLIWFNFKEPKRIGTLIH